MAHETNKSAVTLARAGKRADSATENDAEEYFTIPLIGPGMEWSVYGSRDRRIWAIAMMQHGRVSRRQLRAAEISPSAILRRVKKGYLVPEHPGVYAVEYLEAALFGQEAAALLSVREGALLSHYSAARLWEFCPRDAGDGLVHVTVTDGWSGQRRGVRIHRTSSLAAKDICMFRGLPVTSPARTLLELAALASDRELELAFDQALILGHVRFYEVVEIVARERRHSGRRRLAALLERQSGPTLTRSEAEERLLALVRKAGLPDPRVNVRLHGYEVDFHWLYEGLVLEVDGFRFHSTRRAFEHDRRKDLNLQAAGLATMRVTWRQIEDEPYMVVAWLAGALASASERVRARTPADETGPPSC